MFKKSRPHFSGIHWKFLGNVHEFEVGGRRKRRRRREGGREGGKSKNRANFLALAFWKIGTKEGRKPRPVAKIESRLSAENLYLRSSSEKNRTIFRNGGGWGGNGEVQKSVWNLATYTKWHPQSVLNTDVINCGNWLLLLFSDRTASVQSFCKYYASLRPFPNPVFGPGLTTPPSRPNIVNEANRCPFPPQLIGTFINRMHTSFPQV